MKDILQEIIASKRVELVTVKKKRNSMKRALAESDSGIIAEFKMKSPSKGWIHPDIRVEDVVQQYANGGASATSILTNTEYFGGEDVFIPRVRGLVPLLPILRKEFIIDRYQVYEAKVLGADAILLIAAAITPEEYTDLLQTAHCIGLEVLLEIHDEKELTYLSAGIPDMLGVNNRSLGTFHTDVQHSFDMAEKIQEAVKDLSEEEKPLLVSESGINSPEIVKKLRDVGFRGFLIGEYFMQDADPGKVLAEFITQLKSLNKSHSIENQLIGRHFN